MEVYQKTERALQCYLTGEEIDRLHAAPKELFLLPGEDGFARQTKYQRGELEAIKEPSVKVRSQQAKRA